uniref:Copia protein n=1 Tax=Tanacetum cinerariifolium TaxID=118510 RepID=A0A6L2MIV3_TANCI|nr:copia protein [Tanacetum cinerariifolium]
MLYQLLGRIHRNKKQIQLMVDPWVAPSSCLRHHLNFKGNSKVKDNKIDLLVQQYEQFTILEEESINSGFARFNTIITSLKALDEGFSSKNYVRNFHRALHTKWRAKVRVIEESKYLSPLALDELIAKKESSDDETLTSGRDDEEYTMAVRNFKKFFRRKDQKAFNGGSWSDSKNDDEDKTNDETCLMAQSSNEVTLNSSYYSNNASSLDNDSMQIEYDGLCETSLKIINKNKILKTKRDLLEKEILELNEKIKKLERSKEIEIMCKSCEELKLENGKLNKTQVKFVKFDKSANSLREMLNNQKLPSYKIGLGFDNGKASRSGTKTMSFVGSSAEKAMDGSTIKVHGSTLPGSVSRTYGEKGAEHVFSPPMSSRSNFVITKKKLIHNSIDESKKPTLKPSLKSSSFINKKVYVDQPSGFIDFQKPNYIYKLKKALYGLKQYPKAWYDRLKVFLIKREYSMGMVDNTLFMKKSKSHLIIVQIYVDDVIFGSTSQNLCDDFAKIMHDEFEISMMGELNFFLGLQIKQMEDGIFFNQSKYIKEMLKKFRLEDSKPTKTPMSMEIKLTKDHEAESVDSSKYRGTRIETIVYVELDHAGDYVDRKSTSGVCTFMGCCLTSWYQNAKRIPTRLQEIYNDPNMSDTLRDIYRTLESRYVHEGRNIDPSFYNDLSDNSVAKFTAIGFNCLLSLDEQICPRALKDDPNMSKEQRETRGMFKNVGQALHNFAMLLKKGCSQTPTLQIEDDLTGYDLKHYEAKIEAMNLILISILNDIYNSVDACTTGQAMWQRVERLMRGTVQNEVDRETRFNNEFDQFVAKPGEALYVTQVRLAKRLTKDAYDDLFDYLSQYKMLVNTSRAKKLEKSHDPLALVAHTGSSFRNPSPYYVTHLSSVVDYDDDYQGDTFQNNYEDPLIFAMVLLSRAITQCFSNPTNKCLRTSSNTRNQPIVQGDKVNIQSRSSGNDGRNTRRSFVPEEIIEGNNVQIDAGNIQRTLRTTSSVAAANVQCCNYSEKGPSYDSVFLSEVQNPSTSFVNPLFAKDNQEQKFLKKPKIINNTISDDQIDSNIIFDEPNVDVNSGSVEYDNNVQASYKLEQLARNAYKEAEKQQINAKKTSPNKKKDVETKKNVIASRMYKVKTSKKQEINTHKAKSVLPSTGLKAASSVRRPSNRDSPFNDSVLSNTKNSSEKVEISVRTNKKTYVASKNVVSNKKIITDVDVKNALKAKDVLCVSCPKIVLIPCHDKCLAEYKLNVHLKVKRALFTTPRTTNYAFVDTTLVVSKTRFSVKTTQSKSLDTTFVVSKTKIAAVTPLSARNKKRSSEVSINSVAQQVHNHEESPSTSSIIIEDHEVPFIVTTSDEQTFSISMNEADELNQEDFAEFDGNTWPDLQDPRHATPPPVAASPPLHNQHHRRCPTTEHHLRSPSANTTTPAAILSRCLAATFTTAAA